LDRLTSEVKAIVQTAAVLGGEFDVKILAQMSGRDISHDVDRAETEAIWTTANRSRYLFRHILLRDAAYGMLTQDHLKRLHQAAAEAIESLYPTDKTQVAALAEHWRLAQDKVKELRYTVLAAEQMLEVSHFGEAITLAKRGLIIAPEDAKMI